MSTSDTLEAQAKALLKQANQGIVVTGLPLGKWARTDGVWNTAKLADAVPSGTRVALVNSAGHFTPGTVGTLIRTGADGKVYAFTPDKALITPEHRTARKAHKALHEALYALSDKGLETARKVQARMAAKAQQAEQAEQAPQAEQQQAEQAPAAPAVTDLATLIAAAIAAGLSPADALSAAIAATQQAPAVTVAPIAVKAPRGKAQQAPSTQAPSSTTRRACPACGKQHKADAFKAHKGVTGQIAVCPVCITADGATVEARITRRAKLAKGQ